MARLNFSDEVKATIIENYKNGKTLAELATEADCSIPTISRVLKDSNTPTRSRGRRKKVVNENTVEVDSVEEVSEEEAVSMTNINLEDSVSVNEW